MYSAEGYDSEYEPTPEVSSPEELQEAAISGTFDEGYNVGLTDGYASGLEIGEYGVATPAETSPEYSSSGRARTLGNQLSSMLYRPSLSLRCCTAELRRFTNVCQSFLEC